MKYQVEGYAAGTWSWTHVAGGSFDESMTQCDTLQEADDLIDALVGTRNFNRVDLRVTAIDQP